MLELCQRAYKHASKYCMCVCCRHYSMKLKERRWNPFKDNTFFLKKKHVLDYKIKQGTCEHYILCALFTVNVHQIQKAPYQSDNFSPKLNCSEEQVVIRTDRATQRLSPQITMPKVTDSDLRGTAEPFLENQMCWSHVHLSLKGIRNEKQHVYTGMGTAHGAHVCVSCILKELNLKMRRLWN